MSGFGLAAAAFTVGGALVGTFVALDSLTRFRGTMRPMHLIAPFGFTFEEMPDLAGKHYIVTGGNSGLGAGTVQELAARGANVVLACRSTGKGEQAKQAMGAVPGAITVMELDLNSLKSVKRFANAYKAMQVPLHGLILNAGIMVPPFELTEDGIESQFGVNHVAHFALAKDLLPVLEATPHATVVAVSSLAHWHPVEGGVYLDLAKINDPAKYDRMTWYGQSKLANALFARELARRAPTVLVNSVHPGAVQGNLNRHITGDNAVLKAVDAVAQAAVYWPNRLAALTVLAPAVSPKVAAEKITGQYFVPIGRVDPGSALLRDDALARDVWDFTEDVLKQKGWDAMA